MTYFRMQLPSHGTGPLAPSHMGQPAARGDIAVHHAGTAPAGRQGPAAAGISQGGQRPAPDRPRPRAAPVDHRAGQQKAGPAGGQRRGSRLPGSQAQTGVAPGLSGSGTPAATQINLFWRTVAGCGSEQVAAHIGGYASARVMVLITGSCPCRPADWARPAPLICTARSRWTLAGGRPGPRDQPPRPRIAVLGCLEGVELGVLGRRVPSARRACLVG
jgi:hypothetical protein